MNKIKIKKARKAKGENLWQTRRRTHEGASINCVKKERKSLTEPYLGEKPYKCIEKEGRGQPVICGRPPEQRNETKKSCHQLFDL